MSVSSSRQQRLLVQSCTLRVTLNRPPGLRLLYYYCTVKCTACIKAQTTDALCTPQVKQPLHLLTKLTLIHNIHMCEQVHMYERTDKQTKKKTDDYVFMHLVLRPSEYTQKQQHLSNFWKQVREYFHTVLMHVLKLHNYYLPFMYGQYWWL